MRSQMEADNLLVGNYFYKSVISGTAVGSSSYHVVHVGFVGIHNGYVLQTAHRFVHIEILAFLCTI